MSIHVFLPVVFVFQLVVFILEEEKDNDNDKDKDESAENLNICYIFEKLRIQGYQIYKVFS